VKSGFHRTGNPDQVHNDTDPALCSCRLPTAGQRQERHTKRLPVNLRGAVVVSFTKNFNQTP
jgi:hypothetical protein